MKRKEERKKISFDLNYENIEKLNKIKTELYSEKLASTSDVINSLFDVFIGIEEPVKKSICSFCKLEIKRTNEKIKHVGNPSFQYVELREIRRQYEKIYDFFKLNDMENEDIYALKDMKRINISNGYVVFPNDWVVIKYDPPEDSINAVVIEVMNGWKYNAKHYIFFTYKNFLDSAEEERILEMISSEYPEFEAILKKRLKPIYDINGKLINEKEYSEAPAPGFFFLPDSTEAQFKEIPFGAQIFRTISTED